MKRNVIVIEEYKLPVFTRRLNDAGFAFSQEACPFPGALSLTVDTDDFDTLYSVVKTANIEASAVRRTMFSGGGEAPVRA